MPPPAGGRCTLRLRLLAHPRRLLFHLPHQFLRPLQFPSQLPNLRITYPRGCPQGFRVLRQRLVARQFCFHEPEAEHGVLVALEQVGQGLM
jgi:hypothetical protein